jgi:hypothetical protein
MKAMKTIIIGMVLLCAGTLQAQISVNVNIGSPPMWGPVGYSNVQYYYLPDVYAYYDVNSSMFIYQSGGVWIHRTYLPHRYRNYDLYHGYKVVMTDYHGNTPYTHYKEHKYKYAKGYRGPAQKSIGSNPGRGHQNINNQVRNNSNKAPGNNNVKSSGNGNNKGQGNNKKSSKGNNHGNGHGKK